MSSILRKSGVLMVVICKEMWLAFFGTTKKYNDRAHRDSIACHRMPRPPPSFLNVLLTGIHRAQRQPFRRIHPQRPLFNVALQRQSIMVDPESTVVGQVHALPDSEKELPTGKKPRIEVFDVSELEAGVSRQYKNKDDRRNAKKERKRKATIPEPCSSEDLLWQDIISVLGREVVDQAIEDGVELQSPFKYHEEVEVEVKMISSNGQRAICCV